MAETEIEWTDATWNPVIGCKIISSGCKNCYAMRMAKRLEYMGIEKYQGLTMKKNNRIVWRGFAREDRLSLNIPYKWKKPRTIFVNSMSDLFHDNVSIEFINDVWQVMRDNSHHKFQILTKRPERMKQVLENFDNPILKNVWLGVSVENSETISRIDILKNIPSHIKFVSFEPLIDSVGEVNLAGINWAIVGGESGTGARPIKKEWIDEIYQACLVANTAFFFKQWGAWGEDNQRRSKKANGREYEGKTWDNMPQFESLNFLS